MEDSQHGNYSNTTALETLQRNYSTEWLWKVELAPGTGTGGGLIYSGSCILLRHLNTGLYLCRNAEKSNEWFKGTGVESNSLCMTHDWMTPGAKFSFVDPDQNGPIYSGKSKVMLSVYPTGEDLVGTRAGNQLGLQVETQRISSTHPNKLFMLHTFDPDRIQLIRDVDSNLAVAREVLGALHQSPDNPKQAASQLAPQIIECWGTMIRAMDTSTDSNPFVRDGIPKPEVQLVMVQQGAITVTMSLLEFVVPVDASPIPHTIPTKQLGLAITLLFRFLKQVVKQNLVTATALEVHREFLYQHLNSDFQVHDTLAMQYNTQNNAVWFAGSGYSS